MYKPPNTTPPDSRDYTIAEWVDFDGAEYVVVDGDVQVALGVRVMSTPGHSPGHQSLVIDTRVGTVALAGQAIYSKAEYVQIPATGDLSEVDPPPDPAQYLASASRLIQLEARRVFFSHDRAVWDENSSSKCLLFNLVLDLESNICSTKCGPHWR